MTRFEREVERVLRTRLLALKTARLTNYPLLAGSFFA